MSPHRQVLAAVLALAVCGLPAWGDVNDEPADPLPIRRVLLPADRLAPELARLRQGVLVQLSRAEFEERVRQAARADQSLKHPPRLVEARYRATLTDGGLVGTGQWRVVQPGPGPGLLPLQPLNLALRQTRFENHEALVADFDGRTPALLVEEAGEHSVALDWSARGEARPDGLHFDLKLPPCPIAFLELNLPAGRAVSVPEGVLLSGPLPAEAPDRRLWKVGCGGRPQLTFQVRPEEGSTPSLLLVRRQQTTQDLVPGSLEAQFEFDLEVPHGGVRELRCDYDPVLRPYEVSLPELENWELQPAAAAGQPAHLLLRLREPLREGTLRVRCLAPLEAPPPAGAGTRPVNWTSPGLRLAGAVPRGETLFLRLHPDLRLEDWQPGGFRLAASATDPDGGQRLTLVGGGLDPQGAPPGTPARRPGALLHSQGVEFQVRQLAWWQVGAARMNLTLQVRYEVLHGRLFQLPIALPPGWEIERVELSPAGWLRNWSTRPDQGRTTLLVDLQHPLGPPGRPPVREAARGPEGENQRAGPLPLGNPLSLVLAGSELLKGQARAVTLTVRLQPGQAGPLTGRDLPFPDATPLGAGFREGGLAVDVDALANQFQVKTAAPEAEASDDGPWAPHSPTYYYAYRGPQPAGTLRLQPQPARLRARCLGEVFLASGHVAFQARLVLEAEGGSLDTFDLHLSAPAPGPWEWRVEQGTNQVRRADPLPGPSLLSALGVLGSGQALASAGLLTAGPRGERWRLTLAHPLRPREPLTLQATRPLQPAAGRWEVPLPSVAGAERVDGEVALHLAGADLVRVETTGLREAPDRGGAAWRTFRYGPGVATLALRELAATADRSASTVADQASLTTRVAPDGGLRHSYQFRVANWPQRTLPLHLPAGARLVTVRVDGHWVTRPALAPFDDKLVVELPVPERETPGAGDALHHFEIVYTTEAPVWRPWLRLEAPAPRLPLLAPPTSFRRSWRLPAGLQPIFAGRQRQVSGPGESAAAPEVTAADLLPWPPVPARGTGNGLPPEAPLGQWTEWEPLPRPDAAEGEDAVLLAVRTERVSGAGLVLGSALVLFAWAIRRGSGRLRLGLLLLELAAAGLGVLWLPPALRPLAGWPLLLGGVTALAWYGWNAWRSGGATPSSPSKVAPTRRSSAKARAAVVAGMAALLTAWLGGPAWTFPVIPTGQPATVYLLPAAAETPPAEQKVLAPADLLDQLQARARALPVPGARAVLVGASYEGQVAEEAALFHATFQVYCPADGETRLTLPLDGVLLQGEAWLDGARVQPVALPAPQAGYALAVRDRGRHKVELQFRVPLTGGEEERDLSFTAPRVLQSRLTLKAPAGATYLQALAKHGAQHVSATPEGTDLEVDLGRVATPLHLHWFQDAHPRAAKVEFKEAYLWDLGVEASSLTALIQYRVSQGAVAALDVDLPPELEVRAAEARRVSSPEPTPGSPAGAVRLQSWKVAGAGPARTLHLEFPSPVRGEFQVTLDLVPRTHLAAAFTLPLPAPRGRPVPEGSFLAYRASGLEARRTDWLRVTGKHRAEFAPFWPAASRPDPATLDYVCTLRREPGNPPVLGLHLGLPPAATRATQEVLVRVGRRQAEVQATAELTAPRRDLGWVEWEVQGPRPFSADQVSGPGVRRWHQAGNHLLIWLDEATASTRLTLHGWLPLTPPARPDDPARLDLPCLRLLSARDQETSLRLVAEDGLALSPGDLRNLSPLPEARPSEQELAYVARQPEYGGSVAVRPGAAEALARVLTLAEVRDGRLTFRATVDYRVGHGELRTVQLHLNNWDGDDVRLEAPAVVRRRERRGPPGRRSWTLELRPGVKDPYRCTLTGSVPLEEAVLGLPMPDVSVTGVGRSERWLAVAGPGLGVEGPRGLAAVADPGAALAGWPNESERLRRAGGSVWHIREPDWKLRLVPPERAGEPGPVEILLAEQSAALVDTRHWLHQVIYQLRHEAPTDLNVTWPADVRVVAVSLDGVALTPLQPEGNRLWLPLSGKAGVRRLLLRWLAAGPGETVVRPGLRRPRLEGAREGPTLWTLWAPDGFRFVAGRDPRAAGPARTFGTGPARAAALDLARAEVEQRLSVLLAGEGPESLFGPSTRLLAAQKRFSFYCRRARHALGQAGGEEAPGPEVQDLADRLARLQEANRTEAHDHGFEAVRADAERQAAAAPDPSAEAEPPGAGPDATARTVPLPERGTPYYGRTGPDVSEVTLVLASRADERTRATLDLSGRWLGLLAAVWLLSLIPLLRTLARLLLPEQVALLGALGWHLAGPSRGALALVLSGVLARLLLLAWGARRLLPLRPAPAGRSSHGS